MVKLCLVAPELAPFTAGGIGVLLSNLLREYDMAGVQFHVLALNDWQVDNRSFEATLPGVTLWRLADLDGAIDPLRHPPEWAFTTHRWHYRSYQVAQALGRLASRGVVFDVVEFPDWGGLAFCTTQDKLLGKWSDTQIAVRLHSTDSILRAGQPVAGSAAAAHLADLERKALNDADIIVAHLDSIAQATRDHFGFDDAWREKVRIDAPPIAMKTSETAIAFEEDTPLCFPSKIQTLKRPDVFLNGAMAFLNSTPDYRGNVVFMAHPADPRLEQHLLSRIPKHLKDRISFSSKMPQAARAALLAKGISVFPSPFESFCLAAYEASAMGGLVALNGTNPAFSDQTEWKDGENCLKFDGTALSLADSLGRAWRTRQVMRMKPMKHEATRDPYWRSLKKMPQGSRGRTDPATTTKMPLVSVIVPYFNMGRYIVRTLESILASTYVNLEVIVVDDCSPDEHSRMVLEKIKGAERFGTVRVVSAPANVGLSGARNLGIRAARGEYIFTLDSDDLIRSDFIELGVKALERNPAYSVVVPQTAFIADEASPAEMNIIDHAIFIGEAMRGGSFANRFSTATSLGRREIYSEFPYDENLTSYEDWDFYSRLAWAGKRFIVTSEIYFYYRRRAGSMINTNTAEKHLRNLSILRSKQKVDLPAFAFDMNVVTDAEAYAEFLRIHAAHAQVSEASVPNGPAAHPVEPRIRMNPVPRPPEKKFLVLQKLRRERALRKELRELQSGHSFDPAWYLAHNPDVALSGMDPARHFLVFGRYEGRAPNGYDRP